MIRKPALQRDDEGACTVVRTVRAITVLATSDNQMKNLITKVACIYTTQQQQTVAVAFASTSEDLTFSHHSRTSRWRSTLTSVKVPAD